MITYLCLSRLLVTEAASGEMAIHATIIDLLQPISQGHSPKNIHIFSRNVP